MRLWQKRPIHTALAVGFTVSLLGLFGRASQTDAILHVDRDKNGIADDLELHLANEFAPIVFYDPEEPNLPASVDSFLKETDLWFFGEYCKPEQVLISKPSGSQILKAVRPSCRVPSELIYASGTRSIDKKSTFYLNNVGAIARRGGDSSAAWTTYVHAYRNDMDGVTLQYWRFYAYNSSYLMSFPIDFGTHGGDWEAIHVVLRPAPQGGLKPVLIRLLGHRDIITRPWSDVVAEGEHPLISCEKGSHTSTLLTKANLSRRSHWIEHRSWTGGTVRWSNGGSSESGPIVMLGQKTSPSPGAEWLRYSGLWGTRESSGLYKYYRSGYWGPAFNETSLRSDGFVAAWCEGIAHVGLAIDKECYADHVVP